jgi:hypothetical protein
MSKRTKSKEARHVRLYHWLLKTEAWQSLSPNSRAIYIEMASRYNGSNNGRIPFSLREAAALLHIGRHAAAAAMVELQDRGFIVVTKRSGFNIKTKIANEWRLTEFTCDIDGTFASKDFTRWSATGAVAGPLKQNTGAVAGRTGAVAGQYGC